MSPQKTNMIEYEGTGSTEQVAHFNRVCSATPGTINSVIQAFSLHGVGPFHGKKFHDLWAVRRGAQ